MQALIIKQDGKVYYIAAYHIHSSEAIRKAISSAILVKNQEYTLRLIKDVFPEEAIMSNKPLEFNVDSDLRVRLVDEYITDNEPKKISKDRFIMSRTILVKLAIIEEEKGEEGEDEMWINIHKEISISVIEAINTGRSLPRKESIEALKQQYKITKR